MIGDQCPVALFTIPCNNQDQDKSDQQQVLCGCHHPDKLTAKILGVSSDVTWEDICVSYLKQSSKIFV